MHALKIPATALSRRTRTTQQGVALFIVIVFVMLSMLLALWASRTSLFNELVVGNDADYQRAFEAAQAMLQDAELDIRGEGPDGAPCTSTVNCRNFMSAADKIPLETQDVTKLLATLDQQASKCRHGLCIKRVGRQDFWNKKDATGLQTGEVALASLIQGDVGARYGQYTGAIVGTSSSQANPILADRSDTDRGAWYWIEILPYDESSKNAGLIVNKANANNLLKLNLAPNVVYRVTALAYGRKPGTMAVLQQTYAQQRRKD